MGRRIIALIAAVLLALVGAVLVLLYANGADKRALEGQQPQTVYVTAEVVPSGTTLKDAERGGLIKRTQVAAKAKPAGALAAINAENSGLLALADIAPGQVVLEAAFGTERLGQKAIGVASGKVAISVSLEDPNRVGAFVTPGSIITIYDTYDLKKLGTDDATAQYNELGVKGTSVLLTKVPVIGIGTTSLTGASEPRKDDKDDTEEQAPTAATPVQTYLVTVELTPADSLKLVHAIQHTQNLQNNPAKHIYFGLEGPDTTVPPNLGTDDFSYHGTPR
ncbi:MULTISPECIES: RcpC/CpaB family pilus assembly protein [unclassified Knoellia]|uniref:RcpC/CpaB family pilus assembly protein n=1 Tax=Knoellia altitudinis TaxID=3404795 RepID=UPI00360D09D7